ncbi:hypothetical protein ARMSODRAFT_964126 [Armillaria solidipes]|uniref:Uncharacterized protein n=1 Tax=Armillaria solidipes TaxID=1076256 RepID=A0A2H3AUJ2_9AGAR|nr:hypothetical protein ARMSODRAFT_964126 [Armillaria solidipes]
MIERARHPEKSPQCWSILHCLTFTFWVARKPYYRTIRLRRAALITQYIDVEEIRNPGRGVTVSQADSHVLSMKLDSLLGPLMPLGSLSSLQNGPPNRKSSFDQRHCVKT